MKSSVTLLALVLSTYSLSALACYGEAQIITSIQKSSAAGNGLCSVQVSEPYFNQENGLCGLSISAGSAVLVSSNNCSSLVGKEMSGVVEADAVGNVFCGSSCSVYSK